MSVSTDTTAPGVRIDWYIVPWGACPDNPKSFRFSVRAMPQLCEGNASDCESIEVLSDWPAHVRSIERLDLEMVPAKPGARGPHVNLAQGYRNFLDKYDLNLELASRLWRAAVGDLIDKITLSLRSENRMYRARAPAVPRRPIKAHCSASVARHSERRIADVFAGSLAQGGPHAFGARAMANHGRVDASAPVSPRVGWLRATAAMYASPNAPRRTYERQLRPQSGGNPWAVTALRALADARASSTARKKREEGGGTGSSADTGDLPYSDAYISHLLSMPTGRNLKCSISSQELIHKTVFERGQIAMDDFGQRLAERRLVYASAGSGEDKAPAKSEVEKMVNELHARIASIVTHPWLAKTLGITVDLAMPLDDDVGTLQSIAVVETYAGPDRQPVACTMRTQLSGGFARSEGGGSKWYSNGILNVSARDHAFLLTQIDIDRAPEQYVQAAVNFETQLLAGQVASKIAVQMQPQETVGLSLIETEGDRKVKVLTKSAKEPACKSHDIFMEGLLLGYRPDVRISGQLPGNASAAEPWRSLSARRIRRVLVGPEKSDVTLKFQKLERCEAFLPERTRTTPKDKDKPRDAFIEGELFRWGVHGLGTGPAVPAGQQKDPNLNVSQKDEVVGGNGLTIEYEPWDVPPQRFGRHYRVGVRLAMIDGNSLPIGEAANIYETATANDTVTIGDDSDAASGAPVHLTLDGVRFRRFEPVAPPTVLLVDPLEQQRFPKDGTRHVVVATSSHGLSRERSWRVLVPARSASQDLCLRHGAFDKFRSAQSWPSSAYGDIALTPKGDFPSERGASSEELYFRKRSSSHSVAAPNVPYYPDPWAVRAVLGVFRAGDDRLMQLERIDYYEGTRTWPDCRAWRLCVEAASNISDPDQGFELRKTDGEVTVRLLPGVHVVLRIWHELDATKLRQSAVVEQMAQLGLDKSAGAELRKMLWNDPNKFADIETIRGKLIDTLSRWEQFRDWKDRPPLPFRKVDDMFDVTSFWMINPSVELDLLHAVDRPLYAPAAVVAPTAGQEIAFEIYREPGQTKASFRGELRLDRPSTARVEASAHWIDNPQQAMLPANRRIYVAVPKVTSAHLFALKDVAVVAQDVSGSPPLHPMSAKLTAEQRLQRLDACMTIRQGDLSDVTPVAEDYDFMDTRARAVDVEFSAVSRYAEEFANLKPEQTRVNSERKRFVVLGTRRPDPPEIDYVVPVFNWADATVSSPDQIGRRREAGWFRIWLRPGWYSSGNGELLAVVCWPGSAPPRRAKCVPAQLRCLIPSPASDNYASPDPAIERYITRWGLDPLAEQQVAFGNLSVDSFCNRLICLNDVRESGGPAELIDVDAYHLSDVPTFQPDFDLAQLPEFAKVPFTGKDQPGGSSQSRATLALYRPRLDARSGRMFVDIHLDPQVAYQPFVRLALARYQAHGCNKACTLSAIVATEFVQLLPERTANFTVIRAAGGDITSVRVTLSGTGLPGRSTHRPRSRIVASIEERQFNFAGDSNGINGAWLPANYPNETIELEHQPGDDVWSKEIGLRTRVAHEYSIRIEEYEMLPIDTGAASGRLVYFDRLMIRDL
ncbi:hypothetical protein PQR71_06940 [Paraburkholderia fungorum]|uniref:hypothetical protein n=1 Tax=Paraburkholderia fungorum TaxID=134537 RepID=UPI0038B92E8C